MNKDIYGRAIPEDIARVTREPFSVLIPEGRHTRGDTTTIRVTSKGSVSVSTTNETKSQSFTSCLH